MRVVSATEVTVTSSKVFRALSDLGGEALRPDIERLLEERGERFGRRTVGRKLKNLIHKRRVVQDFLPLPMERWRPLYRVAK